MGDALARGGDPEPGSASGHRTPWPTVSSRSLMKSTAPIAARTRGRNRRTQVPSFLSNPAARRQSSALTTPLDGSVLTLLAPPRLLDLPRFTWLYDSPIRPASSVRRVAKPSATSTSGPVRCQPYAVPQAVVHLSRSWKEKGNDLAHFCPCASCRGTAIDAYYAQDRLLRSLGLALVVPRQARRVTAFQTRTASSHARWHPVPSCAAKNKKSTSFTDSACERGPCYPRIQPFSELRGNGVHSPYLRTCRPP